MVFQGQIKMEISVLIELLVSTKHQSHSSPSLLVPLVATSFGVSSAQNNCLSRWSCSSQPEKKQASKRITKLQSSELTQPSFFFFFLNSLIYIMTSLPISRDEAISRHLHMNADAFAVRLHRDSFISAKQSFVWGGGGGL